MVNREIEVKLPLGVDLTETCRRLEQGGAVLERPRVFEDNLLYDDGALSLTRTGR
ncbi:MAG: adenylate cyclase, partial [Acidobacteria bacterium]